MTFTADEVAEDGDGALERVRGRGARARRALRRRPGGGDTSSRGRAHARRPLARLRHLPRRRDRVAPARRARRSAASSCTIRDLGSLNGTFVNRKRIESAELEDDDEVQIGKYRLTFLRR